jgi:hypothetical protein
MRNLRVSIFLKAGQAFSFECDDLTVEYANDPQKLSVLEWKNASPRVEFIHLDNVAAILYETIRAPF